MEFPSSGTKALTVEAFDTTRHLAQAARQARERGFDKITIVDADTHHEEAQSFRDIVKYIDSPVKQRCLEMIEELGRKPGIGGCVIASPRYTKIQSNGMIRLLAAMEERDLVLAFHGMANWEEPSLAAIDRWGAVQALGVPHSNMVHLTNWLIHGMPERFPKLKVLWLESGVAWAHYLGQRLDNMYIKRVSEAPLLKEKPSRYIKRMFYCSQPLEMPDDPATLEPAFRAINAGTQLVWGSNFPSHEFDVPSTIWDLPFLSQKAKTAILGGNAMRLFGFRPKQRPHE